MTRKWYTLGLLVFAAAACGGAEDDELDVDTIDAEEQTLPAAPMDTTMMGTDTMMMGDTMADTMGM